MNSDSGHPCWLRLQGQINTAILNRLSPAALAYIGDAVYELHIRCYFLLPAKRMADYHRCVVDQVRAEQQAQILNLWWPQLSPEEQDWVRRGRNAANIQSRRANAATYQAASALETLIGYLFLYNPPRLEMLLGSLEARLSPDSPEVT